MGDKEMRNEVKYTKDYIYVGHCNKTDFINEIYKPLRDSKLNDKFNIVLPHENSSEPFNSQEFLKKCKYMIAEVTTASTGLGIELGWANFHGVTIICIHKTGSKISNSLKVITDTFIEYADENDLIEKLEHILIHNTQRG